MPSKAEIKSRLMFAAPLVLLACGVAFIFMARITTGDVYPPYSSLRSDPLGTRILHDSLRELNGIRVLRNMDTHLDRIESEDAVILFIGYRPKRDILPILRDGDNTFFESVAGIAGRGARVVVARSSHGGQGLGDYLQDMGAREVGLGFSMIADDESSDKSDAVYGAMPSGPLENTLPLPWRSPIALDTTPPWRTLYTVGDHPVAAERDWGDGSIVVLTDSYLFSNEAMVAHRRPEVISYILGNHETIIFDETSHGVVRSPGVMGMVHRFRLHGFLIGLLMAVMLFIWNQSSSLIPPPHDQTTAAQAVDMDSSSGLIALLKRHLPPQQLLEACVSEWLHSSDPHADSTGHRKEIDRLLAGSHTKGAASIIDIFRRMQVAAQQKPGLDKSTDEQTNHGNNQTGS